MISSALLNAPERSKESEVVVASRTDISLTHNDASVSRLLQKSPQKQSSEKIFVFCAVQTKLSQQLDEM